MCAWLAQQRGHKAALFLLASPVRNKVSQCGTMTGSRGHAGTALGGRRRAAEIYAGAFPWHQKPIAISMVTAAPFVRQAKRNKLAIFSLSLYEISNALARDNLASRAVSAKDVVPAEYHDFLPLFDEVIARELPPHRLYDHSIPLKEGFSPPFGPIYSLNRVGLETLKTWIEDNIAKGSAPPPPPRAPLSSPPKKLMAAFACALTAGD